MQRFLTFVVLLLLTVPVGLSLQGCANKNSNYCNGAGYGYQKNQPVSITLQPQTTGLSVAFSQTSQLQAPTAENCNGGTATPGTYTYGTTDRTIADVSPTVPVRGGTWNYHTPAVAAYTTCVPYQQDGRRLHDRQRRRLYQQPGCGVFPSEYHQSAAGRSNQWRRPAYMSFTGTDLAARRQGLHHYQQWAGSSLCPEFHYRPGMQ